jgi:MraZ protein
MGELLLSGTFEHTLDAKGRVTLPARYREHFKAGAVLVCPPDNEPCVSVFHPDAWTVFDGKFIEPRDVVKNKTEAWMNRTTYMNKFDADLDGQGRVLIPSPHIKRAKLSGRVTIIGVRTHLEIWDPDTLAQRLEQMENGDA